MWKYSVVVSPDHDLIDYCLKTDAIGALIVANNQFALRANGDFSVDDINKLQEATNKPIIVNINKLFHNHQLPQLEQYLIDLDNIGIEYIYVADLGILNIIKEHNLKLKVIYNTETTITNHYFSQLSDWLGISGIEVAKEINLKEIKTICDHKQGLVSMSGHGHIYMYQSLRPLISNYQNYQQQSFDLNDEYYLYDSERDVHYPIIENEQGTHILASSDLCTIHKLHDLADLNLEYVKLDSFLYKNSDFKQILSLYVEAYELLINDSSQYQQIAKTYLEKIEAICPYKKFQTGFLYKRTVY